MSQDKPVRHGFGCRAGQKGEQAVCRCEAEQPSPAAPSPELENVAAKLVDELHWALDIMAMYERRLIELGDPKELVHSAVHISRTFGARQLVEGAWQLLSENSECSCCRSGNVPLKGWHKYSGGTHPDDRGDKPCISKERR